VRNVDRPNRGGDEVSASGMDVLILRRARDEWETAAKSALADLAELSAELGHARARIVQLEAALRSVLPLAIEHNERPEAGAEEDAMIAAVRAVVEP
jgi:hypothetical protein